MIKTAQRLDMRRAPDGVTNAAGVRISELAERLGTTVRTLRYYEDVGLITPSRTPGNARIYGPDARRQAERVLDLAALGLGGETIREIVAAPDLLANRLLAARLRDALEALDVQRARMAMTLEALGG